MNAIFLSAPSYYRARHRQHRGSTHWYSKGSFEGLVSMAGVAVVRGALDSPNGAVGTVDASKQHRQYRKEDTCE